MARRDEQSGGIPPPRLVPEIRVERPGSTCEARPIAAHCGTRQWIEGYDLARPLPFAELCQARSQIDLVLALVGIDAVQRFGSLQLAREIVVELLQRENDQLLGTFIRAKRQKPLLIGACLVLAAHLVQGPHQVIVIEAPQRVDVDGTLEFGNSLIVPVACEQRFRMPAMKLRSLWAKLDRSLEIGFRVRVQCQ